MLACYPAHADPDPASGDKPTWIDLFNPTLDELATVERGAGLRVPSHEDLSEIESTSRVYVEDGALYLSTPLIARPGEESGGLTPTGFILKPDLLVTIRYDRVGAFADVLKALEGKPDLCSSDVFTRLLEAVVDRAADLLEHVGTELDKLSHDAFRAQVKRGKSEKPLRERLRALGRFADRLSQVRDVLHGVGRLAPFVIDNAKTWMPAEVAGRLGAVRQDIGSLNDYEGHLSTKVQFLLDAVLGFISIEQNDVVKVLTIASAVGVPPVLVAGIYGQNFKNMPELDWAYGYPYSLALMVISALLPLLWFKWRGWM